MDGQQRLTSIYSTFQIELEQNPETKVKWVDIYPEPKKEYPIDYVLDGQQRLTSIYSTFQIELEQNPETKVKWVDIYFDLSATASAQDSQFVALEPADVKTNHVPLRILFDVTEFGKFTRTITDVDQLKAIDQLQALFKEAVIPVETVETEDHSKIAIIFERINRGGVPLDTYQLLSAWTWSGDFDLRTKFDELATELDEVGFSDLRDDPDLLLKCCAGVVRNDSSAHSIVDLKGSEVRDSFDVLRNGVLGAIEFLHRDCGVVSLKVLPYKSMIIPLVRCFATDKAAGFHPDAKQRSALRRWFWHSSFCYPGSQWHHFFLYQFKGSAPLSSALFAMLLPPPFAGARIRKNTIPIERQHLTQNQTVLQSRVGEKLIHGLPGT